MYCKNCGKEIAAGAKFCMQCGTPVEDVPEPVQTAPVEPAAEEAKTETPAAAQPETDSKAERVRPSFDEFQWDVSEYPNQNAVEKTDDINFNWNADPAQEKEEIPEAAPQKQEVQQPVHAEIPEEKPAPKETENILSGRDLDSAIFGEKEPEKSPESMSAAERIDKFYTFNKKNEEFQQLLNKEYNKVKDGNALENELSQAEERASQRFEHSKNPENFSSMEEFLESEGIVKPYQPKAFESDVLERIEAQEAEKEAKRLEEEARLAAIEEARHEAEVKRLKEEAERKKAEEEARRLEEIAKMKAAEEAKLAEEARRKAEEEAKRRAEEEAKRKAEEEARRKAEEERRKAAAEARVKAEEEARLRAEADLKAAQEAAKIRAQQEARLAAEAEAQHKAEQERRKLADIEAQKKLEEKRQRLAEQANQAVAQEEVRKVLEQTARMREEEAAKIKAAVAGLRMDAAAERHAAQNSNVRKDVEDAHRATRNQINEMAKARSDFFTELGESQPEPVETIHTEEHPVTGRDTMLSNDMSRTRTVDKAAIIAGLNGDTVVMNKEDFAAAAPQPAFAEEDFAAAFGEPVEQAAPAAPVYEEAQPVYEEAVPAAASVYEEPQAEPVYAKEQTYVQDPVEDYVPQMEQKSEDDAFFDSLDAAGDVSYVPEGSAFDTQAQAEAQPMDFREENLEDLSQTQQFQGLDQNAGYGYEADNAYAEEVEEVEELTDFGDLADIEEIPQAQADPLDNTQVYEMPQEQAPQQDMGHTQRFDPQAFDPAAGAGLQDTMVVQPNTMVVEQAPQQDAFAANDFDNYGAEEAQNYINQQHAQQAAYENGQQEDGYYNEEGYGDEYEDEANLSKKELRQREKERKRLEKQRAKEEKARLKKGGADFAEDAAEDFEEEKSGGKGRVALKIILIVLIVILAAEVAGMGIKFLAPQSKAAEFIDSQLNKVIQLITGDDTEYSVIAAQVRTEPMDDKTDLITAQQSKNKNKNIKSIVYSADLNYDQERDGKVSDLVLSQPMTQVEWGRDSENYPVYYDEQVVGEIIAFESQRYNLMKKGDESVLNLIDSSSKLYQETSALKNQQPAGEFSKLEIGEIRQAGSKYYVWVRETVGGTSTERVYAMFPEKKFTMKMTAVYDV